MRGALAGAGCGRDRAHRLQIVGVQRERAFEIERRADEEARARRRQLRSRRDRGVAEQVGEVELLAEILVRRPGMRLDRLVAHARRRRDLAARVGREIVALIDADQDLVVAEPQPVAVLERVGAVDRGRACPSR